LAVGVRIVAKQVAAELTLEAIIRHHIERVLQITHNTCSQAARILGVPLSTLRSKMKKLGIEVATQGEQVYLPLGNDSPPQHGDILMVGHLV
jgi:DNA-binding NtrC family response regulator